MILESEGLVVSKSNGRAVIKLSERDIQGLYDVRIALERLAVHLAARNVAPANSAALLRSLQKMEEAVARQDAEGFNRCDIELHRLVWEQSANEHLVKALNLMFGPILMLISRHTGYYDWSESLRFHEDMVAYINAGDSDAAEKSLIQHLENARQRSLGLVAKGLL